MRGPGFCSARLLFLVSVMSNAPSFPFHAASASAQRAGFIAGACSFIFWGLLPLYWKNLSGLSSFVVLAHRVLWSLLVVAPILIVQGRFLSTLGFIRNARAMLTLMASGLIIGVNWAMYIWAVTSGFIMETSLGYYITPLVNAAFGCIFLKERPRFLQIAAIALAIVGVTIMIVGYGQVPGIALFLAITFAGYGFIRKITPLESVPGLFWETLILLPFSLVFLFWASAHGLGNMAEYSLRTDILLVGCGIMTALPMIGFAFAARRLSLITLGLLQYLSPSLAFFIGVFVYHESFTPAHAVAFGCIWCALLLHSISGWRAYRSAMRLVQHN